MKTYDLMSKTLKTEATKDDLNNLIIKLEEALNSPHLQPDSSSFFYNGTIDDIKNEI